MSVCCGAVVWWVQGEKKKEAKHSVKQKQKGQTYRRKCGGRITVDHVHFECRFMKQLWVILCTSKRTFCELIHSTNTKSISRRNPVSAMTQKKERRMV